MKHHMAHLKNLKDFDESLAFERQEKARQERERQRTEVTHFIISERDTITPRTYLRVTSLCLSFQLASLNLLYYVCIKRF